MQKTIYDRAVRSFANRARRENFLFQQPSASLSRAETIGGREHYVLRNCRGELAAYRIAANGGLRYINPNAIA